MIAGLELRVPRADEEAEFLRAYDATAPDVPNFVFDYTPGMPFLRYLEIITAQAHGHELPAGFVPSTFLFAFVADRIVGRVSIRHRLNDFLLREGGHIGYVVVPEFRRRGIATEILRQAILLARREIGIDRLLVTCDDDNVGSIRTIEKNGGALESVLPTGSGVSKRRYWI